MCGMLVLITLLAVLQVLLHHECGFLLCFGLNDIFQASRWLHFDPGYKSMSYHVMFCWAGAFDLLLRALLAARNSSQTKGASHLDVCELPGHCCGNL